MGRKGILVLAVVLMLAVAGCAPKVDDPKDVAAIKAMVEAWGPGITAGDVAALTGQFADNAVRLPPNQPILVGKEAVRSDLQAYLNRYRQEEVDVAEEVRVVGDLAYVRGTAKARATPKATGAAVIDDSGKWVTVFRRQSDGSWKIVVDIWNSNLPPVQTITPGSADEEALLQIERDWTAAWLKQDPAALDGILAEGFVENYQGKDTTKAQMIADMKAGVNKIDSTDISDMRAVVFGDQAIVNGISATKGTERGKAISRKMRWTDVYEKRDGRWRARASYIADIE